jgi:Golgi phosphoprotein 3 (GPP34)
MKATRRLTGTGRIADDLYLLAHDDSTGRPFLQSRALGVGLAAGLLAELAIAGAISVRADRVLPGALTPRTRGLAGYVLGVMLSERETHSARDWLVFLAATAEQDVARRLEGSGYLVQVPSRRPWRPAHWVPLDADCAFAPVIRVRAVLEASAKSTAADVLLTGLAAACGLGPRLLPYGPPDGRQRLDAAIRLLHPDLRELIGQAQAAVDSAVLSHRM